MSGWSNRVMVWPLRAVHLFRRLSTVRRTSCLHLVSPACLKSYYPRLPLRSGSRPAGCDFRSCADRPKLATSHSSLSSPSCVTPATSPRPYTRFKQRISPFTWSQPLSSIITPVMRWCHPPWVRRPQRWSKKSPGALPSPPLSSPVSFTGTWPPSMSTSAFSEARLTSPKRVSSPAAPSSGSPSR